MDLEARATPRLGAYLNEPAALANDAVHRGQAEARAATDRLGRKKWLEDAPQHVRIHSAAGVAHGELRKITGLRLRVHALGVLVERDAAQLDLEPTTLGHGVAGIDGEVHQHLFDLASIAAHADDILALRPFELDVLADQAAQ